MAEDNYFLDQQPDPLPVRSASSAGALAQPAEVRTADDFERDGVDLATIWQILWGRRFWLLAAGAIGVAFALIISLFQTPLYRSTVVLELNPPTVPVLSSGAEQDGNLVVPNTDRDFLATQYGLLQSRNLAERVVQDLNLVQQGNTDAEDVDPEKRIKALANRLAANIDVTPVPASRLVELSYSAEEPGQAARIVNGYASSFLTSTLDRRYEATASAREFLKQRLETVRQNLDDSERKLVAYAKENNIISTSSGDEGSSDADTLAGASLVSLNSALAAAQQRRIAAEQRYRQAGAITETNQSTSAMRQEKARLETEYEEKSTYLKDDYPEMVRLRSRIESLDREIRQEAGQASGALRAEYQAALAEEKSLRARVSQLSSNVLDQREQSIQYNILQRELDTNRSLYDALLERYNEVGVAGGVGTPQASIVDRGEVPDAPYSPNIPRNLILGLLLGLGLGTAFAFAYEFITDTIKSPEDVREKLRLPALGVIPKKKRKEDLSEELADRRSAISEAYSSLLTTLQFTTSNGVPRSLVVTSTRAAEGKSTTSFVLANSLAQLGKRVLLVDADLRKPSFVVEERADLGLSRLLVGNGALREHIINTQIEHLWLMPSGPVPPNPAQLLNSPRSRKIFETLAQHFDVVIVDAPPTHGLADAPLLATYCEAVLLVVESGTTRRRHALEVISRLQASGSLLLGAALTKFDTSASGYGYGYGYHANYRAIEGKIEPHELTPQLLGKDSE